MSGEVSPGFWRDRRVLVTGHTGFKGAWLCEWLLGTGAEVSGLSLDVPTQPSLFEQLGLAPRLAHHQVGDVGVRADVAAAVARARPDVVLHLAAQSLVRPSYADPVTTYATNVMGTVHVLEAARESAVPVTLVVTSDKCYDNREWPWGYREVEALGGHDPYSSSKACAELVTAAYRASFAEAEGLAVASARAGNVIGGGDWSVDRLVPDVMRAAVAGEPVRLRNPSSVRPWQHVLDCLGGYLVLAQALWEDRGLAGPWNFGPAADDQRTALEIAQRLSARWPGGLAVEGAPGPHPHEAGMLTLDSSKARSVLGWRPAWDVDQALDLVAQWYLTHRDRGDIAQVTREQIALHHSATSEAAR
jgi:CDP-glucose 4,6-dehydratase